MKPRKKERYIIDTDVCIDFLRGKSKIVQLFSEILESEEVYISVLTVYELFKGAFTEKAQRAVKEFVSYFETIYINHEIAEVGGKFYREYRKKRITLSTVDCLIMATAKVYGLKIITRNIKHYPESQLISEISYELKSP